MLQGGEFVLEKRKKIEPKRCIPGHQQQNVIFGPSSSMVRVSFRGKSTLIRGFYSHSALKKHGREGERERVPVPASAHQAKLTKLWASTYRKRDSPTVGFSWLSPLGGPVKSESPKRTAA